MSEIKFVERKTKQKVKESDIQKKCMDWLKQQPDIQVGWKASDMYTRGVSDTVFMMYGLFIAIELKKPGEEPTPLQQGFIDKVNNGGGFACWVDSFEEFKYTVNFIRSTYIEAFKLIPTIRSKFTIDKIKKMPLEIKSL